MTRRNVIAVMFMLFVGGLVLPAGSEVSAQMGPGMMGQGMMGQGQASAMPVQQMAEVMKQLADRFVSGKGLDADKAERLRRLVDQLAASARQMPAGGTMGGGMMGGGMMGQGSEQMREPSRILTQISELLRDQ